MNKKHQGFGLDIITDKSPEDTRKLIENILKKVPGLYNVYVGSEYTQELLEGEEIDSKYETQTQESSRAGEV